MNRVIHFEIQADDVGRAKDFYQKAFGWKIEKPKMDVEPPTEYWMIMTGEKDESGINGGMYPRPKENEKKIMTYDCTILVDDIDQAIESVKKAGGKIDQIKEAGGKEKAEMKGVGWFARGTDTEGNEFGLMQAEGWKPE